MDNTQLTNLLYGMMKTNTDDDAFLKQLNSALASAAQRIKDEQAMDDYRNRLVKLLQDNRGGEETTLHDFLAFWLATTEQRDWKEVWHDKRVWKAIDVLKGNQTAVDPTIKVDTQAEKLESVKRALQTLSKKCEVLQQQAGNIKLGETLNDKLASMGL